MTFSPDRLRPGQNALARLTEGLHLMARFGPTRAAGAAGGRQWERWIAHDLLPHGATVSQGPGALRLFGAPSASGLQHEVDGAASAWWGSVLLEAKAYETGRLSKTDVCLFDRKTFDLLLARHEAGCAGPHWRVLASASPVDPAVRAYCHLHGIVVADPELLPLPLLLRYAGRDDADAFADPMLWSELVRLAERAVVPFERRYVPTPEGLLFRLRWWQNRDLDDLLFVQTTLTEQIFATVDENQPEFFAERAVEMLRTVGGTAPAETAWSWGAVA